MPEYIPFDRCSIIVCVTITAKMPTCIVSTNVSAEIADALFSSRCFMRDIQTAMDCLFIHRNGHAPTAVSTKLRQIVSFSAWTRFH